MAMSLPTFEGPVSQALGASSDSATYYIHTFAPEPYRVLRPIPVAIHRVEEEFVATFADANINSSGDNPQEAFASVRDLILDTYERFNSLPADKLGPGPKRQFAVLKEFIDATSIDHEGTRREDR
jgi:hypothetical protein